MASARLIYDDRLPTEYDGEDPDVPRLIGWDGAGLAERPIRKARMREMRGEPSRAQVARFTDERRTPTPREVAAASIGMYDAAWARIEAWKGGAA